MKFIFNENGYLEETQLPDTRYYRVNILILNLPAVKQKDTFLLVKF